MIRIAIMVQKEDYETLQRIEERLDQAQKIFGDTAFNLKRVEARIDEKKEKRERLWRITVGKIADYLKKWSRSKPK